MRLFLGRLAEYFPAALALTLPTAFLPTAEDSFILPRASLVIAGACLGAGLALLTPGRVRLGSMRWPLYAAAGAAIVAFAFSVSWPLSFAGSYTRYESLPMRIAYLDRDGCGLAERGNGGRHRQYWSGRHNHQCHKRHDDQQADDKQECTHDGNFRIARARKRSNVQQIC